jgi:hypothetical protein
MNTGTMSASGEYSLYIGPIYQRYNARLRSNFLSLLGDEREADECLQETLHCFFFFMQDRCWESEAKLIDIYLMRIAGAVSSRRLARRRARVAKAGAKEGVLEQLRRTIIRPLQARAAFKQLIGTFGGLRQPSLRQLSALR